MAKQSKKVERVSMTSPTGVKVTVSKDSVEKYKGKGYKSSSSK